MSDPISIISEMIRRKAHTTPLMAAALGQRDSCRVQRGKKCRHPERNLISSLLAAGRELTDNVGWLKVGVKVSFTAREHFIASTNSLPAQCRASP